MRFTALIAGAALVLCGLAPATSAQLRAHDLQRGKILEAEDGATSQIVNVRDVRRSQQWTPGQNWSRFDRNAFRSSQRRMGQASDDQLRKERIRRHRAKQQDPRSAGHGNAQPEWLKNLDVDSMTPEQKLRVRRALAGR